MARVAIPGGWAGALTRQRGPLRMYQWLWLLLCTAGALVVAAPRILSQPVIYTSTSWWTQCVGTKGNYSANSPLWVARYASAPGTLPYAWTLIEQENTGQARARHKGILQAQGEIVVIVDDDMEMPMPVPPEGAAWRPRWKSEETSRRKEARPAVFRPAGRPLSPGPDPSAPC